MPADPTRFESLSLSSWRQFRKIRLKFHPRLTVLTGENGAGKSTLLDILARHSGLARNFVAAPEDSKSVPASYHNGVFDDEEHFSEPQREIGMLKYVGGHSSPITVPKKVGWTYSLTLSNEKQIPVIHFPAHRWLSKHQQLESIPIRPVGAEQAYNAYRVENQKLFQGGHSQHSPIYRLKEHLMMLGQLGPGNENSPPDLKAKETFDAFVEVLGKVLPRSVGFQGIRVPRPDVVLVTKSGTWPIDAASGGIMAIIDIAYQIFLFSLSKKQFVVTIDEPENHLHPSMQRTIMGDLIEAFPDAQFVVATHSPFVVSSVREAAVYALKFEEEIKPRRKVPARRINSIRLDMANLAGSTGDILRDVLGVPVTMPVWVEQELEEIIISYRGRPFTDETLNELRAEMAEIGFGDYYPHAVAAVADGR